MFIVRGQKAILRQFNRQDDTNVYDDQNYKDMPIKCCPYDIKQGIRFGIYTVPEAKGYYQVPRQTDARKGDQIKFIGKNDTDENPTFDGEIHTILEVQDAWLFNRVENKILAVK